MTYSIITADFKDPIHQQAIIDLLDHYAQDPMGGGSPLSEFARDNLISAMAERSFAISLLAFDQQRPVGLLNAFEGFSTFACKPLINIHDIVVHRDYRGKGISKRLLRQIEEIALAKSCCKLTLEVLSNNEIAKSAYRSCGFNDYQLKPEAGVALFWEKKL